MLSMLSQNWWMLALRGVAAIIFGILVLAAPAIAISTFVLLFGAYALVDGIFAIITAVRNRTQRNWWVHLLEGIIGVVAGLLILLNPLAASIALPLFALYMVAFWAIFTGVMEIWAAVELRKEIEGEFWLGLSGLLSILFGIFLLVSNPVNGILALLTIVSIYAIAFGVVMILLALRVRGTQNRTPQPV